MQSSLSKKPSPADCADSERAQALNKGSTDELLKEASVLLKHAKIDRKAQVGILDCMKQLPSGATTPLPRPLHHWRAVSSWHRLHETCASSTP